MGTSVMRKGYVDTSGGQLHYRAAGTGRPLILLHQSPSSGAMWEPVVPGLGQAGFSAVSLDMPGYGMSDVPPHKPDVDDYARWIVEAADALGFQTFDLLGHHTGASIALVIADRYPDRVGKLVLWGVPHLPPPRMDRLANEQPFSYSKDGHEVQEHWVNRGNASANYTPEIGLRSLIERLQLGNNHRSAWGHNAIGVVDHDALLRRIKQPTLIMDGPLDVSTYQASIDSAKIMPNAQFLEMAGASMDVADEQPEAFVENVRKFLLG